MEGKRMIVEWTELPPEITETISKKLTNYADYLRFRCVCRTWRSSVPKTPLHLPPQLPWLMLSHRGSFFDLSTNKTHFLNNLPISTHNTRISGSSHGWLVILDDTPEIRLLNPITRATLFLPPLHTFPNVVSFDSSNIGREYQIRSKFGSLHSFDLKRMRNLFLTKLILSFSDDDVSAFAIDFHCNLLFYRQGFDYWISLNEEQHTYFWEDAVCYNGLFVAVGKFGFLGKHIFAVCDVEGSDSFPPQVSVYQPEEEVELSGVHTSYVVFSGEELLLVTRILEREVCEDESKEVFWTVGFKVFKMDWDVLMWRKIDTLGERAVFLGRNSSVCCSAAEVDFAGGCCADCIYFTHEYCMSNYDDACAKHDFGVFKLSDQSIEPLPCYPRNSVDSQFGWPLPIWFTPNPC